MEKNFWIVLLLTIAAIFVNLGSIPLLDPDEPVYAETAKEMIRFNDFISPRIYGEYWYDKPPMYYWLVAVAFNLFGINEFAARVPSALLAVLCVAVVCLSASKLFGERAGVASGLILSTSVEFFYLGKAAVTDITLTLFLTASLLCFLHKRYCLFYLFSALATLTKGPIGFLLPGAIVVIWMVLTRRFGELKQMKIPLGIVIWAAVALPWYLAMYRLHGFDFVNGFIDVNNIARFTTAEHEMTAGWYFFIPVLILGFFPWTALLFQTIKASLQAKDKKEYDTLLFLNSWAVFIFLFFSLSNTKLLTYILPLYPPLSMLVGWYLEQLRNDYRPAGAGLVWPALLTVLSLLLAAGMLMGINLMPAAGNGAVCLVLVLILMTLAVWYFLYKRSISQALWGQAVAMVAVSVILVTLLFPPLAGRFNTRDTAQAFLAAYDGQSPVYVQEFLHPGFTFYTDVYGQEIDSSAELRKAISADGPAYFVLEQQKYQELTGVEKNTLILLTQSDDKVLLKKR